MAYGFNEDFANYEAQQSQRMIDNQAKAWELRNTEANTRAVNQQTAERQRIEDEANTPEAIQARANARQHVLKDSTVRAEWDYAAPLVGAAQDKDPTKFNQLWDESFNKALATGDKKALAIFDHPKDMSPSKYEEARRHVLDMNEYFAQSPENVSANSVTEFGNKSQSKYNQLDQNNAGAIAAKAATTLNSRQVEAAKVSRINDMTDAATARKEQQDDAVTASISESNIHARDRGEKVTDQAAANDQKVVDFKRENDAKTLAAKLEAEAKVLAATAKSASDLEIARVKKAQSASVRKSIAKNVIAMNSLDAPKAYIQTRKVDTTEKVNKLLADKGIEMDPTSDAATGFTSGVMSRVSATMQQYAQAYENGEILELPNVEEITNAAILQKVTAGEIQSAPWYTGGGVTYKPSLESMALSIQTQPNTGENTPPPAQESIFKPINEMSAADQDAELAQLEADKAKRAKVEANKAQREQGKK